MIKFLTTSVIVALISIAQHAFAQVPRLVPNTAFGTNGDGTIRADEYDWLSSSNAIQRGMAYNPTTGHLLVACRTNAASPTYYRIMIVDAATGTVVTNGDGSPKQMDLSSLVQAGNASFLLNQLVVADDGAIYGANLSNAGIPAQVALYRWANEDAVMQWVYGADPANGLNTSVNRRWGDTMAARGSGLNTEVLMASRGTAVAIFRPTSVAMDDFSATTIQTDTPAGALGYGICFGPGNTFWGTAGANTGGPLFQMSYNIGAQTATTLKTFAPSNGFPGTVSQIGVLASSNLLVGLDTRSGADMTRLYDISNLINPPVLLSRVTWFSNYNNNTFSGAVTFGTNGNVYVLDAENGISAYNIVSDVAQNFAPSIILQPIGVTKPIGSNYTMVAYADGDAPVSYQWYYRSSTNSATTNAIPGETNPSLTLLNLQLANSGGYSVVASNVYGTATSLVAQVNVVSAPQAFLEAFDYPVGDLLAGKIPGTNGQPWNPVTGVGGAISNISLSYPGLPPSTGNSFVWPSPAANVSERIVVGTNVSGSLFFSFLLRVDAISGNYVSDTIAGFGEATNSGNTVFDPKININSNSPGVYQLGVYKGGGTAIGAAAPNLFNIGDTVLVVGNYNFISDPNNDTVNMWVNPDPSTFGASTPPTPSVANIGATSGTDMTQLSHFFFRSTANGIRKVADELRIGYTWAEVTPQAVPVLSVATTSTNRVLVMWPSYYLDGYVLQASTNVTSGWASVTNAVAVIGTNNVVSLATTNAPANRFFRLIR